MRHKLRFVGVLIGSALFGGLAVSSDGQSQELSIESGASGELNRQATTAGELPAASGFQELNTDQEPPLPYVEPEPEKPVAAVKPVVEPVTVETQPKVKSRPAKTVKEPKKKTKKVAPTPALPEGKVRIIPIEEIPIIGTEVVSETEEPTTPQRPEKRATEKIDRN